MDKTRRQEIASRGGRSAHAKGKAHRFTPDEARQAGLKGGASVSKDRAHMSNIGRIGGQKSTSHHRAEPEVERPAPKAVAKKKKKGAKKAKRKH
jgi:general stress protein YciG